MLKSFLLLLCGLLVMFTTYMGSVHSVLEFGETETIERSVGEKIFSGFIPTGTFKFVAAILKIIGIVAIFTKVTTLISRDTSFFQTDLAPPASHVA